MTKHDDFMAVNKRHWEKMVKEGCGFTRPWLELDVDLIRQYVKGQLSPVPEPLLVMYPSSVLAEVEGNGTLIIDSFQKQHDIPTYTNGCYTDHSTWPEIDNPFMTTRFEFKADTPYGELSITGKHAFAEVEIVAGSLSCG